MKTTTDLVTPQRLQDWAHSCGLRMNDICREAGIARSTWWRWKTERNGMTLAVYIRLVDALKTLRDEKQRGRELIERGGDRRQ
jgi:transcriptional regulator with XRE-family HTH domain